MKYLFVIALLFFGRTAASGETEFLIECFKNLDTVLPDVRTAQVRKNGMIVVNKTKGNANGFYLVSGATASFCPLPAKGHFDGSVALQFYYLNVISNNSAPFKTLYKVASVDSLKFDDPDDEGTLLKLAKSEKAKVRYTDIKCDANSADAEPALLAAIKSKIESAHLALTSGKDYPKTDVHSKNDYISAVQKCASIPKLSVVVDAELKKFGVAPAVHAKALSQ